MDDKKMLELAIQIASPDLLTISRQGGDYKLMQQGYVDSIKRHYDFLKVARSNLLSAG